ncbi:hypothetical protein EWB00_001855, partial [Schistosoma japonicum]
ECCPCFANPWPYICIGSSLFIDDAPQECCPCFADPCPYICIGSSLFIDDAPQ